MVFVKVEKKSNYFFCFYGHFSLLVRHIDVSTKEATATNLVGCHIRELYERGITMKNISMQNVFNDLNGRIIYRPYDVFEKNASDIKSGIEKLRS